MSATPTPPADPTPQELRDFLTSQGIDPATVSYWQVVRYLKRRQDVLHQRLQALQQAVQALQAQQQTDVGDIAAIKQELGMT